MAGPVALLKQVRLCLSQEPACIIYTRIQGI